MHLDIALFFLFCSVLETPFIWGRRFFLISGNSQLFSFHIFYCIPCSLILESLVNMYWSLEIRFTYPLSLNCSLMFFNLLYNYSVFWEHSSVRTSNWLIIFSSISNLWFILNLIYIKFLFILINFFISKMSE